MSVLTDIFESLFGGLDQQADTRDAQAAEYLEQLMREQGAAQEIQGAPVDITGRTAQAEALRRMQGIAAQGGLTAEDRARMDMINRQAAQQEQGQRQAIMQQQGARGALGGGAQLAQQLMAQQEGASRRAQGGLQTAAEAQRRALEAIQQSGGMGAQLQGSDAQAAAARNAIAQFNAQQRENAMGRTAGLARMKYGEMGGEKIRAKQKRGEEALGGLIGGGAQIGARLMTGGMI